MSTPPHFRSLRCGLLVMSVAFGTQGVAGQSPLAGAVQVCDGSFAGWQAVMVATGDSDGSWSVSVADGCSSGNAFLAATLTPDGHTLGQAAGVSFGFWHPGHEWDPQTDGPIESVSVTLKYKRVSSTESGAGQGLSFQAWQGAHRYFTAYSNIGTGSSCNTKSELGLIASDFVEFNGGSALAFGVGGSPIRFGFGVSNSTGSNGDDYTVIGGYDDWCLTITPRGLFTTAGYGCQGSNGLTPQIGNDNLPGLGFQNFRVNLCNAPADTLALHWVGLSPFDPPLPGALFGATGCDLFATIDIVSAATTDTGGEARASIPIPDDPTLVNFSFRCQWVVLDPSANTFGFTTSNFGVATIE